MANESEWFHDRGVSVAVVSFAKPERLRRYHDQKRWPFLMLADPDRTAYAVLGFSRIPLHRLFSPRMLLVYWRLWRKGRRSKYEKDDIFQGGGDALIDAEGRILYIHRSHDPADRPSVTTLKQAVESTEAKRD